MFLFRRSIYFGLEEQIVWLKMKTLLNIFDKGLGALEKSLFRNKCRASQISVKQQEQKTTDIN